MFDAGDNLLAEVPQSCDLTIEDLEILKRQKVVEAAGYQWQEHSRGPLSGGREYLVAITRSMMPMWTPGSPSVVACGYKRDRLTCWKEVTVHAAMNPAIGSKLARAHETPITQFV